MGLKAYLKTHLGHAWTVIIGFLILSGLIGFFSTVRGFIEVFSLTLMGIYSLTTPWLEPLLAPGFDAAGVRNQNHIGTSVVLCVVASLVLTLIFAVLRGRHQASELRNEARIVQARRDAEALDGVVAGGAVGGGALGLIAGAALGLLFPPALPVLLAAGGLAGGVSGASASHDDALVARARQPDIDDATRRQLEAQATRYSLGVFGGSLLKATLICCAVLAMTHTRSYGWNVAREMELHTEWRLAQLACHLTPADTKVIEPVERWDGASATPGLDASQQPRSAAFCRDILPRRKKEASDQTRIRRADERYSALNRVDHFVSGVFSRK